MQKIVSMAVTLVTAATCGVGMAIAQLVAVPHSASPGIATSESFLLGPPMDGGPVVVRTTFEIHDINEINDEQETFEFAGVLTLRWHDKRQIFDPVAAGVDEKIYQGDYQFDEVFTGWFPQVVLVNESGSYEKHGVVLRVQADGTLTLIQTLNATAKVELNVRRYPLDHQRLEAVFEVLGFDDGEVVLQAESATPRSWGKKIRIPQWSIIDIGMSIRDNPSSYAGPRGVSSAFVVSFNVQRQSFFISRLVIIPLIIIVLLSFSVFWMDRSSLGDRTSVSFIGILTAVAYQIMTIDILPQISYFTLINAFLNLSFLIMCGTVVINLVVGALDQQGKPEVGDRIDRRCRWIFPLAYFGLTLLMVLAALLFY